MIWELIILRRNILSNITNKYISQCLYEETKDPFCPVFKLGFILDNAEQDEQEKYLMLSKVLLILQLFIHTLKFS